MHEARVIFGKRVYAKSTATTKESRMKLYVQIAEARNLQPFPLAPFALVEGAAVLRAAEFSIRKGFPWDEQLEVAMKDVARALPRALGPVARADKIRSKLRADWVSACNPGWFRKDGQPEEGPAIWVVGSVRLFSHHWKNAHAQGGLE